MEILLNNIKFDVNSNVRPCPFESVPEKCMYKSVRFHLGHELGQQVLYENKSRPVRVRSDFI